MHTHLCNWPNLETNVEEFLHVCLITGTIFFISCVDAGLLMLELFAGMYRSKGREKAV